MYIKLNKLHILPSLNFTNIIRRQNFYVYIHF